MMTLVPTALVAAHLEMEYCIAMIRELGLKAGDMWTPPADGQKAIQRTPLR